MLRITKDQFNELYPDLIGSYEFFNEPVPVGVDKREFERRWLVSKLWRLNNLYTVVNKEGQPVVFRMNYAQHKVYAASRLWARVIILKSRQQGISTFWLVSYFDDATFCPHLSIGLMAQGTDEASTLLERAKFLWDELSADVKAFLKVSLDKDNAKAFAFSNNSTIFIRVSFRSATLQRLHISEFGKIANQNPKRAKETKTGTLQALGRGNTGIIESTAEGRNEFKAMWDGAVLAQESGQASHKDFYPVFLSWLDDPDCVSDVTQTIDKIAADYFATLPPMTVEQKNFWIIQYRELGGDIHQEYPATPEEAFTASRDGTYYSRLFVEHVVRKGGVRIGLYDENLPIDAFFDLGVDDYFVVVLRQWYRGNWRIIDEYLNDGYAITHYIDEIVRRGYVIRSWNFPHDTKVREIGNAGYGGRAKSREEVVRAYMRQEGIPGHVVVLPRGSISNGIEAVRLIIPTMLIDIKCTYIIDCLHNYSKEWDPKLQVWKITPLHDIYSHGADVLREMASNTVEVDSYNASRLSSPAKRGSPTKGYAL